MYKVRPFLIILFSLLVRFHVTSVVGTVSLDFLINFACEVNPSVSLIIICERFTNISLLVANEACIEKEHSATFITCKMLVCWSNYSPFLA